MADPNMERLFTKFALGCFCVVLIASGPARPRDLDAGIRALAEVDRRVDAVTYRLVARNAARCDRTRMDIGIGVQDIAQYAPQVRARIRAASGFAGDVVAGVVAPTGPAAAAGIVPGTAILSVDGTPVLDGDEAARLSGQASADRLLRVEALLDEAEQDGTVDLTLRGSDGSVRDVTLAATRVCAVRVRVRSSRGAQAVTDDWMIEITTGMVTAMRNDDELSAMLAHELGHYILHHYEEQQAAPATTALMRRHEEDADRLSVHLMAGAGFDPAQSVQVWTHFAALQHSVLAFGYHGTRKERRARLQDEIARMQDQH